MTEHATRLRLDAIAMLEQAGELLRSASALMILDGSPKCATVADLGAARSAASATTIAVYWAGCRGESDANRWSSAADGVHCIDPTGRLLGKILVPHTVSNLVFGDRYRSRLFIGGSHTLYSIFLNRRGAQVP